ncbi:hypothetical protein [Solibacillus sp. NPDC093137]
MLRLIHLKSDQHLLTYQMQTWVMAALFKIGEVFTAITITSLPDA